MSQESYALITGASSGIGECFARALAGRGRNLVLVARSKSKLQSLADELGAGHGVVAEPVECDLSVPGAAARLAQLLTERRWKIDLLVNNAGFGARGKVWELPLERQVEMVRLNILALMELTHLLLPPMVAERRGAIINVSSMAGFQATPYTSVYGATKAFVTAFSEGLAEELRPLGVKVVTLCPGGTRTNFHQASGWGPWSPPGGMQSPEEVVEAALRTLPRGGLVIPRLLNKLSIVTQRLVPRRLVVKVTARMFRV